MKDVHELTELLLAIWSTKNADFQEVHSIGTREGFGRYFYWLLDHGVKEFPAVEQDIKADVLKCGHVVNAADIVPSTTPLLESILSTRTDLVFGNGKDEILRVKGAWDWYLHGGYADFGFANGLPCFEDVDPYSVLQLPSESDMPCLLPAYAGFLNRVSLSADDYGATSAGIGVWFYVAGLYAVRSISDPFGESVLASLVSTGDWPESDFGPWVHKFHDLVWKARAELSAPRLLPLEGELPDDWWSRVGREAFSEAERRILQLAPDARASCWLTESVPCIAAGATRVSLVGYPKGEFGLGEDIRLLKLSLETVGISADAFRGPGNTVAREHVNEQSLDLRRLPNRADIVFFAMPAFDTLMMHLNTGYKFERAHKKIGFWQWELEKFPRESRYSFELVDVVWCHSEHSARAFRSSTEKNVIKVPLPVQVPDVKRCGLDEFTIADGCFVFFTSFDGASYISRKNPLATIEAFQRAFPKRDRSVRLIMKVMNQQMCSLWRECLARVSLDDRIVIFDGVVDRNHYFEILKSVDAVVSLHRAEGFGRLMAEAMVCGVPVIASGYSGNMDYMTPENSWIVPGEMVPVLPGDYPFRSGQRWFAPDVDECARMMRECREDDVLREGKTQLARHEISERYSLNACGAVYKKLIELEF